MDGRQRSRHCRGNGVGSPTTLEYNVIGGVPDFFFFPFLFLLAGNMTEPVKVARQNAQVVGLHCFCSRGSRTFLGLDYIAIACVIAKLLARWHTLGDDADRHWQVVDELGDD
jgi:hypothetical protein